MKYCEKSIRETGKTNAEIIRTIYDNMKKNRPEGKVIYRPYTHYTDVNMMLLNGIDFGKIYPEACDGDCVYVTYYADGIFEKDMFINIEGNDNAEVWFNGEKKETVYYDLRGVDTVEAPVTFKEGKNLVLVKLPKCGGKFKASIRILLPGIHMGAEGYVYSTRPYVETDGFMRQELMQYSRLYKKDEDGKCNIKEIDWVFPVKPEQTNVRKFDFKELCKDGRAAFVYTECKGKLKIEHHSPIKIMNNQNVLYSANGEGVFENDFKDMTSILIKSINENGKWGFTATDADEHNLSFVDNDTSPDLQWMWAGSFGRMSDPIDCPYIPETNLDFRQPMPTVTGGTVYWRFYRKDTYLSQYLQSAFWGQWFYAVMVGLEGMRHTANKLGITEFYDYFKSCMETLCAHREFGRHTGRIFKWASYMGWAMRNNDLDSIGSFGMAISEYYLMTGDDKARALLEHLANAMFTNVPRFPDGTFNRVKTMWTDDMYMSLPFLVRMGLITGEDKYFDEAAKQIFGFYDRMYMKDQNIYSHIFFPLENVANRVPWGRGNGWVLLSLSEVLMHMPETHKDYARILEIFRNFAGGVIKCRDKEEKIWHQVINNHESYIETSGSAMFTAALARGVKYGWLDATVKDVVVDAWDGLTTKCVDREGNVYGVCMGSGHSMDESYYMNLGTIFNDDHGVGIVLTAGVAVMEMLGE